MNRFLKIVRVFVLLVSKACIPRDEILNATDFDTVADPGEETGVSVVLNLVRECVNGILQILKP